MSISSKRPKRYKSTKRIKFKDKFDYLCGRYFIFTFFYGIFYIVGAGIGYSRTENLFCLIPSGIIGIIFTLFSVGHCIDYYRRVDIESFYVAIPWIVSMFVGIFMSCIWGLGTTFKSAKIVAIVAWIAVVFYSYAILKDYSDGSTSRYNDFHTQHDRWYRREEIVSRHLL